MPFVSITRLRLRSVRFLPFFVVHTLRSLRQVKRAPGFCSGSLLPDRGWTFWTLTLWDKQSSMRRYMTEGSHRQAMPYLMEWCDEASVVHWEQSESDLPAWDEADRRMRSEGRASKVHYPSDRHAALGYDPPRVRSAGSIRPARVSAR